MDFGIPSNLHVNIRRSSDAYLAATVLSIIYVCFNWKEVNALPFSTTTRIGIMVCSFGINIIIAWLIRLGIRWIRVPLLVLTVLGSLFTIPALFIAFKDNIWFGLFELIGLGLQIYASVILFIPETSGWYEKKKWGDLYEKKDDEED